MKWFWIVLKAKWRKFWTGEKTYLVGPAEIKMYWTDDNGVEHEL
jgi:hypothetical protein